MHNRLFSAAILLLGLASFSLAQSDSGDFPTLTSTAEGTAAATAAATSGGYDGITNAPSVTNSNAVPTYPAPSVPPTADAPFMEKSAYPPGTVFICFGAALGFLLLCVLLWHAWVAWSIHRSMQRAKKGYMSLGPQGPPPEPGLLDRGVHLLKKSNPFYAQRHESGSMIAMSLLHNDDEQQQQRKAHPHASSAGFAPDKKSLFFSPTASSSSAFPATRLGPKRTSEYMPSGYYAAGGPDRTQSQLSAPSHSITEQHDGAEYVRRGGAENSSGLAERLLAAQQSSASLNTGPGSRAPSTYLEDMFNTAPTNQDDFTRL